jgi:hypothetical protein
MRLRQWHGPGFAWVERERSFVLQACERGAWVGACVGLGRSDDCGCAGELLARPGRPAAPPPRAVPTTPTTAMLSRAQRARMLPQRPPGHGDLPHRSRGARRCCRAGALAPSCRPCPARCRRAWHPSCRRPRRRRARNEPSCICNGLLPAEISPHDRAAHVRRQASLGPDCGPTQLVCCDGAHS